jgi:hypothetical protein
MIAPDPANVLIASSRAFRRPVAIPRAMVSYLFKSM